MADVVHEDQHARGWNNDVARMPPELHSYFEYWHHWYNIVVHRGANVLPRVTPQYPVDFVSDDIRSPPYPQDISETWYCAALIALILAIQHGAEKGWLFETAFPYPLWAGRVFGRTLLTVGAAVLSTLSFEVIGSFLSSRFLAATTRIEDWVSSLLIKHLRWGEVDENGEPQRDEDDDFIWVIDPTNQRESIRDALQGLMFFALDYFATSFLEMSNQIIRLLVERVISPVLYFLFSIPVSFVPNLLSWLFLPTPGSDGIRDPRTLWHEYGMSVLIQFWLLVLLWLLEILYIAKADRLAMAGLRVIDPLMTIKWHLFRATAMHLLAYTAYQLVCGCMVLLKSGLPQDSRYIIIIDGPAVPFLRKIIPNGKIFAAALLFFFHWLLRAASILSVRLAKRFWMPYILWQTRYSIEGADRFWPLWIAALVEDLTLLDPKKRVTSRVAMTAIFGLRSSWPARFHLSNVVEDE
ncbi:hypothetical protein RRF57_007513 [Xylaria bambusicola]|uniref:Uncharacterized protein n=1 Tax=Xylaria bambusicola TaxID=326684 RepID=A0AAN7UVA7_9PEZI